MKMIISIKLNHPLLLIGLIEATGATFFKFFNVLLARLWKNMMIWMVL